MIYLNYFSNLPRPSGLISTLSLSVHTGLSTRNGPLTSHLILMLSPSRGVSVVLGVTTMLKSVETAIYINSQGQIMFTIIRLMNTLMMQI